MNVPELLLYRRYIDDVLIVWKGSRANMRDFCLRLSHLHPKIHFTWSEIGRKADYLDINMEIHGPRMILRTHRKRMNKYLYVPWSSYHTRNMKRGFIKAELLRFIRNSSNVDCYNNDADTFKILLRERGYPVWFLNKVFTEVDYGRRKEILARQKNKTEDNDRKAPPHWYKTDYPPWMEKVTMREITNPIPSMDGSASLAEASFLLKHRTRLSIRKSRTLGSYVSSQPQ